MNTYLAIFGFQLTVGLPEIIIFQLGALLLGFSIHFFWNSRKNLKMGEDAETGINENDNWKLKYYNDMDMQERMQQQLRDRLSEVRENEQILNIEIEELKKEITRLEENPPAAATASPAVPQPDAGHHPDYISQLLSAQQDLSQHNSNVARLLEQIETLKANETRFHDLQQAKEILHHQVQDLQKALADKENEIKLVRQGHRLTEEMGQRLDKAYSEYNILQEKLQKLETHLVPVNRRSVDYDELQESYFKLTKEFDELKLRQLALWEDNQRLNRILSDTEDKLREANFQRQQLQKKMSFLEELNSDLQEVTEHNKKLESQLKRISEMEALMAKTNIDPNKGNRE